jgi:CBS-domain-containing membrane protein
MLVEDLMTRDVGACRPADSLADAAALMWRFDCGAVPVAGEDGAVVGMLTDRDICMALATRRAYASDVRVEEVMSRDVVSCTPEDDAEEALELMRQRQLRRLPVVDGHGRLAGILSVADVLRRTRKVGGRRRVKLGETLATLKAIVRPHGSEDGEGETANDDDAAEAGHAEETAASPRDDAEAARE